MSVWLRRVLVAVLGVGIAFVAAAVPASRASGVTPEALQARTSTLDMLDLAEVTAIVSANEALRAEVEELRDSLSERELGNPAVVGDQLNRATAMATVPMSVASDVSVLTEILKELEGFSTHYRIMYPNSGAQMCAATSRGTVPVNMWIEQSLQCHVYRGDLKIQVDYLVTELERVLPELIPWPSASPSGPGLPGGLSCEEDPSCKTEKELFEDLFPVLEKFRERVEEVRDKIIEKGTETNEKLEEIARKLGEIGSKPIPTPTVIVPTPNVTVPTPSVDVDVTLPTPTVVVPTPNVTVPTPSVDVDVTVEGRDSPAPRPDAESWGGSGREKFEKYAALGQCFKADVGSACRSRPVTFFGHTVYLLDVCAWDLDEAHKWRDIVGAVMFLMVGYAMLRWFSAAVGLVSPK